MANKKKRIVVKLGTHTIIDNRGELAGPRLGAIIRQCNELLKKDFELVIVSSGAVGLGKSAAGLGKINELPQKQACAAIGQNLLMNAFKDHFSRYNRLTAQVLLSASDFSRRTHYLNLKKTVETLLSMNVVPVINENDTISTQELEDDSKSKSFGDNDKLSALVASELGAEFLLILTNVEGIYNKNPDQYPDARKIDLIEDISKIDVSGMKGQSAYGRGGITSKLEAARIAGIGGVTTMVASAIDESRLEEVFSFAMNPDPKRKVRPGTLILPLMDQTQRKGQRKKWIGFSSGYEGVVVVNTGAKTALVEKQASLLPAGVSGVEGKFEAGQVISIRNEVDEEIGRGVSAFSSDEVSKIMGKQSSEIKNILGKAPSDVVIHRDYLVIFGEKHE